MPSRWVRGTVALALTVSLLTPRPAMAWGDNGHIAVAKVADLHLTAKAKAGIKALLGPNVNIYDRKIAMFADTFKTKPAGLHTKPWHFVDIPTTEDVYDATRDCDNNDCVDFRI